MVTITIPTAFRAYVGGMSSVRLPASTVSGALTELAQRHPRLRQHLYNDGGDLRTFVNVYLGDTNVRDLTDGTQAPLSEGATLTIVPSIAGG